VSSAFDLMINFYNNLDLEPMWKLVWSMTIPLKKAGVQSVLELRLTNL
jgi:hypothetical protein